MYARFLSLSVLAASLMMTGASLAADDLESGAESIDPTLTMLVTGDSAVVAQVTPLLTQFGRVEHVDELDEGYALALVEPSTKQIFTISVRDEHGETLVDETLETFARVADRILPARIRGRHPDLSMFDDQPMRPATGPPVPIDFQGRQPATPGQGC